MKETWSEYVALLEEISGLDAAEAQGVADAERAYDLEARQLQNTLAQAERDFVSLKERNTRLQVGVRDLGGALGAATPATADAYPVLPSQLAEAMKAAEYDLGQLRRSLEYMRTQREAAAATPPPVAPPQPAPVPQLAATGEAKTLPFSPLIVGAVVGLVLLVVVLVILI